MKAYKCTSCSDTGCAGGIDHDGMGAGVIGPYPEPCQVCNPGDKTGQVAEQTARAKEWNAGVFNQ